MPGFAAGLRGVQPVCLRSTRSRREGPQLPGPTGPVAAARSAGIGCGRERYRTRGIERRVFNRKGVTMPRIEQSLMIDAPVDTVAAIARDVEAFPQYMEDVESITVLERSEDGNR